jgi:hypothetical protein
LEVGLEDRLQEARERPLDHAVADRRDREDSDLAAALLRDLFPPAPQGPIRAGDQFVPELLEERFDAAGSMAANVTPSIPGAPLFAFAAAYAVRSVSRLPTWTYSPQKRQDGSAFALA